MAIDGSIDALRNIKTQKLFVLLDDIGTRVKVVNPQGETLSLPVHIFENEPLCVNSDEFGDYFSQPQLDAYEKFQVQMNAELLAAEARAATVKAMRSEPQRIAPKPKSNGPKREKKPSNLSGLAAKWNSSKLTFYAHRINPLHPKQSFRVSIDDIGEFEITKEDFLTTFNDVVLSAKYRQEGLFAYNDFPEKARRFLRSL